LPAAISHDIKNPTASIQAIAEFQALTTESEALRQADFRKRSRQLAVQECLVMADRVRFAQVADFS